MTYGDYQEILTETGWYSPSEYHIQWRWEFPGIHLDKSLWLFYPLTVVDTTK